VSTRPSRRRRDLLDAVGDEARVNAASAVRFNLAMANQLGMPLADLQCIGLLVDGPSTPSWLAERLGLTTGAVTKLLDRLQQAGYITRSADPADRRRIIVAADPERLSELAEHYAPMGEHLQRHVAGYSDTELELVLDFLRAGREAADQEISRMRRGGVPHAVRRPRDPRNPSQIS
jgi:DNA-binding MarR family transcriptional regulator